MHCYNIHLISFSPPPLSFSFLLPFYFSSLIDNISYFFFSFFLLSVYGGLTMDPVIKAMSLILVFEELLNTFGLVK